MTMSLIDQNRQLLVFLVFFLFSKLFVEAEDDFAEENTLKLD